MLPLIAIELLKTGFISLLEISDLLLEKTPSDITK